MDSRHPPQWIRHYHLKNQSTNIVGDRRPSPPVALRPGEPSPESSKSISLPTNDGVGLDENQDVPPVLPHLGQTDPEEPIQSCQQGSLSLSAIGGELAAQGQVLNDDGLMAATQQS